MRKYKRALIIGLAGFNLGDEAIAVAAHNELKKKYDLIEVTTVNAGALKKYGIEEVAMKRRSLVFWINIAKSIWRADAVFIGGGSLVQDKLGVGLVSGVLGFFVQVSLLCCLLARNVKTLPIGIDELRTRLGRFYAYLALRFTGEVYVRDSLSMSQAESLSRSLAVKCFADPAYLINVETNLRKSGRIIVSLVYENIDLSLLRRVHEALLEAFSGRHEALHYIVMDMRCEDELSLYEALHISPDKIIIPSDVFAAARELRRADLLVAMRLHAMILAQGFTPIVGISRTTKTVAFCEENSVPYIELFNLTGNLASNFQGMVDRSRDAFGSQVLCRQQKEASALSYFNAE